jgi:hypothetical protein
MLGGCVVHLEGARTRCPGLVAFCSPAAALCPPNAACGVHVRAAADQLAHDLHATAFARPLHGHSVCPRPRRPVGTNCELYPHAQLFFIIVSQALEVSVRKID